MDRPDADVICTPSDVEVGYFRLPIFSQERQKDTQTQFAERVLDAHSRGAWCGQKRFADLSFCRRRIDLFSFNFPKQNHAAHIHVPTPTGSFAEEAAAAGHPPASPTNTSAGAEGGLSPMIL